MTDKCHGKCTIYVTYISVFHFHPLDLFALCATSCLLPTFRYITATLFIRINDPKIFESIGWCILLYAALYYTFLYLTVCASHVDPCDNNTFLLLLHTKWTGRWSEWLLPLPQPQQLQSAFQETNVLQKK